MVKQKTARSRFTRTVQTSGAGVTNTVTRRWQPSPDGIGALSQKLRGHFNYYGINGNSQALARVHLEARRAWQKWLSRRSQRGRLTWARFRDLLDRYPLPPPRVVHSVYRPVAKPVL